MYLGGFHIDGFGVYHDQGIQNLPLGLVLFLGDNESGKTTLMEFLRTQLFGFPRHDKKKNLYEPLRGGNQGGRLRIIMQDGRQFTIGQYNRRSATLTPAGGATTKAEPALNLFSGIDRETYNNVFAVGLKELQGLGVLSQDGVRGRIFAAGAGLGSASVPELMKNLDKEMASLLAQRGQKQINLLLKQLREIENQVKNLQSQASAYAEGQQQREQLELRIAANRQEAVRVRRQVGGLEQLEQAWLPWTNRNLAREKSAVLEFARNFPVNGKERLESLLRDLDLNRQQRKLKDGEVERLDIHLNQLTLNETVLAQQESIESLVSEREKLANELDNYPTVKSDLEQALAEFQRKLRELGPAWDAAQLSAVDTSVQVRQRVTEFGRRLDIAERNLEAAMAHERAMTEAVTEAQKQADAAQKHFQAFPVPPLLENQTLADRQEAFRRLQFWWHQRDLLKEKLLSREQTNDEIKVRAAALEGEKTLLTANLPWWLGLPWLVMGIGLGGWFFYQQDFLTGGIIPAVSCLLAALFFWLHHRQTQVEEICRTNLKQELGQMNLAMAGIRDAITDLKGQIEAADKEIFLAAQILDREPASDAIILEEIAADLEQAASLLREWQSLKQAQQRASEQLARDKTRQEKARTEREAAALELNRLQDEWAAWLLERGFSETVRPAGFEAVLQAVENARSEARNLESCRRRLQLTSTYLDSAKAKIYQVLTACEMRPKEAEPGVADLDALRQALTAALAVAQQQRELGLQKTASTQDLNSLISKEQELQEELEVLLRQAEAADVEDFRRRGAAHQKWQELSKTIEAEEIVLRTLAGTKEAEAALMEGLSHADPLELKTEKSRLADLLNDIEKVISQDDQEIGDLKGRLRSMEQDRQLGDLLLRQRSVEAQFADAIRRWATLAVCRHLLDESRKVYERERQPQVIQEADHFLNIMAHGRYRILTAAGEGGVHLEDRSMARREEVTWSAGLADQVYLSIRLGLAREFGRHSEPLPVMLDDVLVKFDPSRRSNAARVILDFAREQQVLLFSCQPKILDIIQSIRRNSDYRQTAVAAFAITDGIFSRLPEAPLGTLSPPD